LKLRRLKKEGIEQMNQFLDSFSTDSPREYSESILTDPATSEEIPAEIEFEQRSFQTRMEAAQYLDQIFSEAKLQDSIRDKGLWAWLALFYFEALCPEEKGKRRPGNRTRWIPELDDYRRYYRHLLAGPYFIYRAHRDDPNRAMALLCNPLNRPGDIVEQLASRQELVTNNALVNLAKLLYLKEGTQMPKRGAGGKGPGSARRLADILDQFVITFDLYSMNTSEILTLLPAEFDKFRPTGVPTLQHAGA
jgi:hypothetical protein